MYRSYIYYMHDYWSHIYYMHNPYICDRWSRMYYMGNLLKYHFGYLSWYFQLPTKQKHNFKDNRITKITTITQANKLFTKSN